MLNSQATQPEAEALSPTVPDDVFADRMHRFHRSVYASTPFVFDDVMTPFWQPAKDDVAHDHCLIHALDQWHLFVLSRPLEWGGKLVDAIRRKDWKAAERHPFVVGDLHLAGSRLKDLKLIGTVLTEPQGEFGTLAQTNSYVYPVGDRFALMYCTGGPNGQRLGLDWSDDLVHWTRDSASPVWEPPVWSGATRVCKAPCIVRHGNRYLIYYNLNLQEGLSTVSLISTEDFTNFHDHGAVLKFPFQFRGTQGCESPCVFEREGIWHLMVSSGDYWWHTISNRPDRFMTTQDITSATVGGVYDMGPFHVSKVVEHQGKWLMTSSYKAEWRRQCRQRDERIFRGEDHDERGLCKGLFVSDIQWDGDRPVLAKTDLSDW